MAKKIDQQYAAYERQYKQKQKQGFTLEPKYSKKTFADIQKQMKIQTRNPNAGSVEEILKSQTVALTSREKASLKAALEQLEKNWEDTRYGEMSREAADSLNDYFNMSNDQRRKFLKSPQNEEWRKFIFENFGSFGYYYQLNSPT